MSYEPTRWQTGDTVTSAKLNKMEQGIANSGIKLVHVVETEEIDETTGNPIVRLDITPNGLKEALDNGQMPILLSEEIEDSVPYNNYFPLVRYTQEDQTYICYFYMSLYTSTDSDEYFIQSRDPK